MGSRQKLGWSACCFDRPLQPASQLIEDTTKPGGPGCPLDPIAQPPLPVPASALRGEVARRTPEETLPRLSDALQRVALEHELAPPAPELGEAVGTVEETDDLVGGRSQIRRGG